MAAFQRFGNLALSVDDFVEIFLSMKEKLGAGKEIELDILYKLDDHHLWFCVEAHGGPHVPAPLEV